MTQQLSAAEGCGKAHCGCADLPQAAPVRINGIALHGPDVVLDAQTLRERAYAELLRQRAVQQQLLAPGNDAWAPTLTDAQRQVLEDMAHAEIQVPAPTEDECRRYYAAHLPQLSVGQVCQVRHILFAVTPGVNVHALAQRAEAALLELSRKGVAPDRFGQLARELSNCPSSAQGGDLGWIGPADCAPELAQELFYQNDAGQGRGLRPRLIHTRFGFHIIDVLERHNGELPTFEQLHTPIAQRLTHQARATALRQYMRLLVGQAKIEGIELDGAESPLVQ